MLKRWRMLLIFFAATQSGLAPAQGTAPEQRTATIDVRQGKLHYVTVGERKAVAPLIALNGGPGLDHSSLLGASVWHGLSKDRPIIFYDQRGMGGSASAVPASAITIDMMVEDLEALRQHLDAPRMDLLGHSWGGILAMAYAIKYPDRVSHLVLVGSGSPKPAEHEYLFDRLFPEIVAQQVPDESPAGKMGCVNIQDYARMSYYDIRNRSRRQGGGGTFSQEICTAVMLEAMKIDLFPQLRTLRVPTLVINGRFDANVAPTVAYAISNAIPGSKLEYFERSGHSPFVEEPDKFELVVGNFLKR
jgi:proline iminopeptidase